MSKIRKGRIVKTKSEKTGYVYNDDPIVDGKAMVYVVDESFNTTGEKLLCSIDNLRIIGFKD